MPKKLKRVVGRGDLHFVNFCCYQRRALLGTVKARNLTVRILEEVRKRYKFKLIGYVIMPEHVHLLIGESANATSAKMIQIFKQRLSRQMRGRKTCHGRPEEIAVLLGRSGTAEVWAKEILRF